MSSKSSDTDNYTSKYGKKYVLAIKFLCWWVSLCLGVPLLTSCHIGTLSDDIGLYISPDGLEELERVARDCSLLSHGLYNITVHRLPRSANEQRLQLARRLIAGDNSLDLMEMDVVWTAEFANAGWVVPVPDKYVEKVATQTLAGPYETATWKNRLYAFPMWANTELLWYRKDLVTQYLHDRVPQNWDELIAAATRLHELHKPSWIGASGRQYEGLLSWFNSLIASAGGQILSRNGKQVTLADTFEHNHATEEALRVIHDVATYPGQDPSFGESDEDYSRLTMENGSSAFEINWPYVFASMRTNSIAGSVPFLSRLKGKSMDNLTELLKINDLIREKFDFAPYPSMPGGKSVATLGGTNIGVASTSHKTRLAFQAAQCLTKPESQIYYAVEGGVPPTAKQLYLDPMVQGIFPAWRIIHQQLSNPAIRPKAINYRAISILVTSKLSPVTQNPPSPLAIEAVIRRAISGKGLVP